MKNVAKLNNNYYIEFVDNTDKLPIELVNIKNIKSRTRIYNLSG